MPEFTSQERIEKAAKLAYNANTGSPEHQTALALRGLLQVLLAQAEEQAFPRLAVHPSDFCNHPEAQALLPRVESLEVRADLAEALGTPLAITPADPDPGRDWSRVEAHLFKPGGKWMYQVWLDYTGERFRGVSGEGPHGWHFDGTEMAHRALSRATANGTSEVSIRELGSYWHMFVPHPPQGYPHWIQPSNIDRAEDES